MISTAHNCIGEGEANLNRVNLNVLNSILIYNSGNQYVYRWLNQLFNNLQPDQQTYPKPVRPPISGHALRGPPIKSSLPPRGQNHIGGGKLNCFRAHRAGAFVSVAKNKSYLGHEITAIIHISISTNNHTYMHFYQDLPSMIDYEKVA